MAGVKSTYDTTLVYDVDLELEYEFSIGGKKITRLWHQVAE